MRLHQMQFPAQTGQISFPSDSGDFYFVLCSESHRKGDGVCLTVNWPASLTCSRPHGLSRAQGVGDAGTGACSGNSGLGVE